VDTWPLESGNLLGQRPFSFGDESYDERTNERRKGLSVTDTDLSLDSLTPDPQNACTHGERNLQLISEALTDVGAARSIVVDETGTVLAGNVTVAAAGRAGFSRVRIIDADGAELIAVRRSGLTPDQKRRLALYDNRTAELAEWDTEILAALAEDIDLSALWKDDELGELLRGDDMPITLAGDPDAIPEIPEEPITQPGDLWLLGPHHLLCGDATNPADVRRLMDGERSPLMPTIHVARQVCPTGIMMAWKSASCVQDESRP